jgi:hypothetical protein
MVYLMNDVNIKDYIAYNDRVISKITLSRFKGDYGRDMDWGMDLLPTTSNYSAIANLHTSQITTAPDKPFTSLLCHQPFPGNCF